MRNHPISRGAVFGDALVAFVKANRDVPMLTAWIAGGMLDPADRRHWRVALKRGIAACRRPLARGPSVERGPFEAAVRALEAALPVDATVHNAPGMVMFATAAGDVFVLPVDAPPRPAVTWKTGPRIAPWLAVSPLVPAIVAIADREHATFYRLAGGALTLLERLDQTPVVEPGTHMGNAPRRGFHTGTRGETQRDAAARRLREARERHAAAVAARLATLAGVTMDVVIGGMRETADLVTKGLPAAFDGRVARIGATGRRVADADLANGATRALQALDAERQVGMVRSLLDAIGASGHAACGAADVLHALERGAVDHLIVAPALVDHLPDALDQVVQESLGERAVIEVARPPAARLLEAQAGGIAARLRFPVPTTARARAHVRPRPHRRQRTGTP
ncbi:MAG TPA: hypothetical protein VG916_00135 [Gemmatimonadaceae bacterium]|nr:hypothetical protein [Gemmatimonadaceae bacterium]